MNNINIMFFWHIFVAKWKAILITALIFGIIAFTISKVFMTPIYESTSSLYFGKILNNAAINNIADSSNETKRTTEVDPRLEVKLLNSLNMGLQLVNDYRELIKTARLKKLVNEAIAADNQFPQHKYSINIDIARQTRLMKITVQSNSPELSRFVALTYTQIFMTEAERITGIQNFQVIDDATFDPNPVSPKVATNTLLGVILGLLLSYGVFFLITFVDNSIKSTEDITELLKLPLLGTVPFDDRLSNPNFDGSFILSTESSNAFRFNISEHFRAIRVNLQYDGTALRNKAKVIVVTSAIPAEGKSFNSSNIAASLAESGKKVLLVNCDLRKPTLQKIFKRTEPTGLVNVLVGEKSFDECVQHHLCGVDLDVLFCGPIPPNPSRLLISDEFKNLIEEQSKNYDYIFLDSPPNLAIADATIIGALASGVLLVVRAGYAGNNVIQQAVSNLKQAQLNIIGVVLNRFSFTKSNGYGYGYGYDDNQHKQSFFNKIANFFAQK